MEEAWRANPFSLGFHGKWSTGQRESVLTCELGKNEKDAAGRRIPLRVSLEAMERADWIHVKRGERGGRKEKQLIEA